ncbi:MAG TPA: bifunctional (p)ppGpp synthetase/guanosine-3',5'-bis(diphosphate) 3'-pyrophosphohydrolase [Halanaerobiaceae bacterium]|jgi:guanosine-3',5'-bis(diphosphate) 3'-pyrophosphohydrolase|nr:bifunctional (p)ppGpp synthetase/guanosine-3',5'-bis(diphosphate) 3'-pyrophosphohydrolase [Halanaerobiaceae bacterium]
MLLEDLLAQIKKYMQDPDLSIIEKAYAYAEEAHRGQFRYSGEPFIEHPLGVAFILAELELDIISIAAALLHDVVEDTEVSSEAIRKEFGEEIAILVDGVTKLSRLKFQTREELQVENLRKMFIAMAEDIRVILIKLADRLHNMRTLKYLNKEKRIIKAQETLEIYAPLAHRLGISRLKWELEDLAFLFLEPEKYYEVARKVAANRAQREKDIQQALDILQARFNETKLKAETYGRPKHLYSIYQKMQKKEVEFEEIYDLTAVRIIVDSVRGCYEVLGIVHELWKPIPGRFKDYIAMPKSNMYQSLHTTVIGPKGDPLEIQIRTQEMHRTAEYGIAAHWRYKEGKTGDQAFEEKLSWLRQLLEWQKELQEPQEFMEALKIDLFEDEVFVFTPKGDVISLPRDSTPVDFAFSIHTEIGYSCIGAKVNGQIKPLDYRLQNGDIVEIQTTKVSTGPSRDWLNFVKTSKARSKIKYWFKMQARDEILQRGKELVEKELRRRQIELKDSERQKEFERLAKKMGKNTAEEILEMIGYNQVTAQQIVNRLKVVQENTELSDVLALKEKRKSPHRSSTDKGVRVKGVENLLVRLAKCCNPVPGDKINGFITRGRGVSIHRADCPNMQILVDTEKERIIPVEWDNRENEFYQVNLAIEAYNKKALLNDITSLMKEEQIELSSVVARTDRYNRAHIQLSLELNNLQHMQEIMQKLDQIPGILSVHRA